MKCPNCQSELENIAKFCSSCGTKIETDTPSASVPEDKSSEAVSFRSSSERVSSDGIRGEKSSKTNKRTFYNKARYARDTVEMIEKFLYNQNLETQIIENNDEIIVQAKQKENIFRKALGLDQAITIDFSIEGNDLITKIGGAKWLDKAAGTAIGILVFYPVLFTTGWGAYKQNQLLKKVEKEIESFLMSKS